MENVYLPIKLKKAIIDAEARKGHMHGVSTHGSSVRNPHLRVSF